jgi:peptidoglycan/LPS O-acetylase OafA/YrhL
MSEINTSAQSPKPLYFASLTGIRAVAAFLVFFVHYNPFLDLAEKNNFYKFAYALFSHFHIGVSIFFVLSGFLITVRYRHRIEISWEWARRYLRNRVARIYPMYFLVTVCTVIASQVNIAFDPSHLWRFYNTKDKIIVIFLNLTFLRGFFDRYLLSIVGQGWSLTVEECFYLSAPFLLLGLRQQWRRLLFYPVMLLGIGLVLAAVGSNFHDQLFGFFGSVKFMLNWTFFGRCLEFLAGMTMAIYLEKKTTKPSKLTSFTLLGIAWIAGCLCALVLLEWDIPIHQMGTDLFSPAAIFVRNAILPFGISVLFWGLLHEQTQLKRILETKTFDLLGKSSYAFYLVHGGILNAAMNQYLTTNIFFKFALTNVVAILAYLYVEHPVHKILTANKDAKAA